MFCAWGQRPATQLTPQLNPYTSKEAQWPLEQLTQQGLETDHLEQQRPERQKQQMLEMDRLEQQRPERQKQQRLEHPRRRSTYHHAEPRPYTWFPVRYVGGRCA